MTTEAEYLSLCCFLRGDDTDERQLRAAAAIESLLAEKAELRKDAERFAWWFVHSGRGFDIREYMLGIMLQWDLDMWREKIDKAMEEKP